MIDFRCSWAVDSRKLTVLRASIDERIMSGGVNR